MGKKIKICQHCFADAVSIGKNCSPCVGATMCRLIVCRDCRQETCTCKKAKKTEYNNFYKNYRKKFFE